MAKDYLYGLANAPKAFIDAYNAARGNVMKEEALQAEAELRKQQIENSKKDYDLRAQDLELKKQDAASKAPFKYKMSDYQPGPTASGLGYTPVGQLLNSGIYQPDEQGVVSVPQEQLANYLKMQQEKELADKRIGAMLKIAGMKKAAAGGLAGLTPGQKAVDVEFGKKLGAEEASGASTARVEKNLELLQGVIDELGQTDKASGPWLGLIPEGARASLFPESIDIQERALTTIQESLKPILGAQFAQKEGEQVLKRAFNPQMPESFNAKRLKRELDSIRAMAQDRKAAVDYFVKNKTLAGYSPRLPGNIPGFIEPQAPVEQNQANDGLGDLSIEELKALAGE